ncbi:hypothetical protein N9W19_00945 [bacterium]|nr:hypothetical protein [bacterium]
MSEWYYSQKKPSGNLRKLLQFQIDKVNPRRTLTAEEQRRLSKLEHIAVSEDIFEQFIKVSNTKDRKSFGELAPVMRDFDVYRVFMSFATILTLIDLPFVLIIVLVILLKAEMETIQQQMAEAKKNERANALKEAKRLCKEFGFTAGMLKGSVAERRKKSAA